MSHADDQRVKEIRDRFKLGWDADDKQRQREKLALKMYGLEQWEEPVLRNRDAQPGNGRIPATGARPCLVLDMLREPVNQIVNQERESDLAVELIASDDFGAESNPIDPAEIELREGLIRRIQRESESASARTWAFTRAVICGRGYYAINTRYAKGKTFDQDIYCRRLYDQTCVVLDPSHTEPDGSDAEWGFYFTDLSFDAYKADYPRAKDAKNSIVDCQESEWAKLVDDLPDWFMFEGETRYVRVAEYWYTERTSRELCELPVPITLPDGRTTNIVYKDEYELPEGVKPLKERTEVTKTIKWCKVDGCQILDETEWPSPYVPIIKIVGNELPPHDKERHMDGIVNKSAIESQRGRNYMGSRLAEEFGLATVAPLMVEEGTIEGYEDFYSQANTRAFAWLPFKRTNLDGQPGVPPFRPDKNINVGQLATGMQVFNESIQSSTNVSSPQMGRPSRYSETWRGTKALIDQGERGTSNYMDNFTRSVRHEGRIMNSLLYPVYGERPGRMARIVQGEGEAESVMIGQPFIMQDNGQGQQMPRPAPPGATGQQEGVRDYRLTEQGGSADVAVKVKKGYDTRRQEEGAVLGEVLGQQPQFMSVFGDLWLAAQDWPGAKDATERMRQMLDPKVLAYLEQKKGGQNPIPPQALQQIEQMQQQLQQVTQAAQQMQQDLQTKATETQLRMQGEERIAQIKVDGEIRLAEVKASAAIQEAEIKAGVDLQTSREKAEADLERQRREAQADINQAIIESSLQPEPVIEEQV